MPYGKVQPTKIPGFYKREGTVDGSKVTIYGKKDGTGINKGTHVTFHKDGATTKFNGQHKSTLSNTNNWKK